MLKKNSLHRDASPRLASHPHPGPFPVCKQAPQVQQAFLLKPDKAFDPIQKQGNSAHTRWSAELQLSPALIGGD